MRFIQVMVLVTFLSLTGALPAMADDLRCGNDLVNIGDRAFMVAQKCGEPVSKQNIGYTLNEELKREFAIEEWVYGPQNGRDYYFVTFIAGRVTEVKWERK